MRGSRVTPFSIQVPPAATARTQAARSARDAVLRITPAAPAWRKRSASDSLIGVPHTITAVGFVRGAQQAHPIGHRMCAEAFVHHQNRGLEFAHRRHGIFHIGFRRDHARTINRFHEATQALHGDRFGITNRQSNFHSSHELSAGTF